MKEFRTKIQADGSIIIPTIWLRELHLSAGEELIIQIEDQELRIFSVKHAVQLAQETVRKYNKSKKSLVNDLIKTRRNEAKYE